MSNDKTNAENKYLLSWKQIEAIKKVLEKGDRVTLIPNKDGIRIKKVVQIDLKI